MTDTTSLLSLFDPAPEPAEVPTTPATSVETAASAVSQPAAGALPVPADWPAAPDEVVYHGLAGEIVRRITPETEADPIAILTQLLVSFGAAAGRGAFFQVEATRHHPNEFMLLTGDSARARKGSSWDHVLRLITGADRTLQPRILTGLSSGEGVVWTVRDPAGSDPGHPDQRLLVIEPEFASVLKASSREISTLSPVLRCAWDGRPLQILTRSSPARSSHAHVSVIGHITREELRRHTTSIELSNGYMNRILVIACRRQRLLPDGGDPDPLKNTGLQELLAAAILQARKAGQVTLTPDARELWHHAYRQLALNPADGIVGQITARAEAHVIRLALIYALTDTVKQIRPEHLTAALALHDYAARSAAWALQGATGHPLAEHIHALLTAHPAGLTRSQLSQQLQHHQPAGHIDTALTRLQAAGRATVTHTKTGGRPAHRWTSTPLETSTGAARPRLASRVPSGTLPQPTAKR